MKLYYSKGACSLAVRILLHELNLDCEFEAVNLKTKQTESGKDFLKINPKGEVPTLILDNGETLTENVVIQTYLVEKHKATKLLPPADDFKHYRVLEWLMFITTDLHKGFGPLFNPTVPQELKNSIFIPNLKLKFDLIEHHLKQNKYLMGDQYTLPDGYLFVLLRWVIHFDMGMSNWPNLERYMALLSQRKSIHQSLEEEGLIKATTE